MKPWEKYQTQTTDSIGDKSIQVARSQAKPWEKYGSNAEQTNQEQPQKGFLSRAGSAVYENLIEPVSTALDYTYAPVRQAMMIPQRLAKGKIAEAFSEPIAQLGRSPSEAPTTSEVLEAYGVPKEKQVMPIAANPTMGLMASTYELNPAENDPETVTIHPSAEGAPLIDMAAGGLGADAVTKGASKLLRGARPALEKFSQEKAIKQAGGMLKDFRRVEAKGRTAEVGKSILGEKVNIPTQDGGMKNVPLLKVGDKVEDIAEKSKYLKQQIGEEIGGIYQAIDERITNPDVMARLTPEKADILRKAERFDPSKDVDILKKGILQKYGKKLDGKKTIARVESLLDDMKERGNTLSDSLSIKNEVDDLINHAKATQELPDVQKALMDVRNYIRDKTNKYVEAVGDALEIDNAKNLKDLNRRFGNAAEVNTMAIDKVARNNANRMASPSDYFAGGVGYMTMGPKGMALGLGNKLMRERGPGFLARSAEALAKRMPESVSTPQIRDVSARAGTAAGLIDRPKIKKNNR